MIAASRILVTGGAGFIGSHLCERLLDQGREVLVLDNFNEFYDPSIKRKNIEPALANPAYTLVEGDIRDEDLVRQILSDFKPQAVIHLAAMAGVRPSLENPHLYNDVNIRGTTILLEAVKDRGVENFLFGSSSSVYGAHDTVPFSERDVLNRPVSPYAATKLAGEQICFTYHHLYQLPVSCLRFFTVYGPRQRPEMAIHLFASKMICGEPITVFGDGSSRRDYTYISDIVDGVCLALDKPQGYEIYNLGESRTVLLSELISLIEGNIGKVVEKIRKEDQPGDVPVTYADISKARAMLGYDPSVPVEDGIRMFIDWLTN